ncbi:MAG: CYTH domain-containing protein [Promethearchaeota archaeon]
MKEKALQEYTEDKVEYTHREYQLKFKMDTSEDKIEKQLISIGAKKLGTAKQKDEYYIRKGQFIRDTTELLRLREESNEKMLFTFMGPIFDKKMRIKLVYNEIVEDNDVKERLKWYRKIITLHKVRTIYLLNNLQINIDKFSLPKLGIFIEFSARHEDDSNKIFKLLKDLSLREEDAIKDSYYKHALLNISPMERAFQKMHDIFGKMAFGISSAGLTVLGLIIGVNAALASKIAIIAAIACIAVADSMADAFGIYSQTKSEGMSSKKAFANSINNFVGKLIFASSFMIPFFFFNITQAIIIDLIWGFSLLIFVNFQIAIIQDENKLKSIIKNVVIAVFVLLAAFFIGHIINILLIE